MTQTIYSFLSLASRQNRAAITISLLRSRIKVRATRPSAETRTNHSNLLRANTRSTMRMLDTLRRSSRPSPNSLITYQLVLAETHTNSYLCRLRTVTASPSTTSAALMYRLSILKCRSELVCSLSSAPRKPVNTA